MIILIYFIGSVISFTLLKLAKGKKENTWEDVSDAILCTILSWFGAAMIFIFKLNRILENIFKNSKPPKWM